MRMTETKEAGDLLMPPQELTRAGRLLVLAAAFLAWFSAGVEMGLVPLTVRPAVRDLLFPQALAQDRSLSSEQEKQVGFWFANSIAVFLLGGAFGGLLFGRIGDRLGRVRAMGLSVLCFSLFTTVSWWVQTPEQLLVLRFLAGLGVGGTWPSGVALVSEAWPDKSRPFVAGAIGTSANLGILAIALVGLAITVAPTSWRWVMLVGGTPALLGILVFLVVPESPRWLAEQQSQSKRTRSPSTWEIFQPPLLSRTLIGICLGTIPLLGSWGSGKWLLPWAQATPGADGSSVQTIWAGGAALGSAAGGWLASQFGRRLTYFLISLTTLAVSQIVYHFMTPDQDLFLPGVFLLGLVATIFFGWLPLYLPELFPTRVRATGSGVSFNFGRFGSAAGVLATGALVALFAGNYAHVGATTSWIYALGMLIILLAPNTQTDPPADRKGST
jgi:SHS family sialic acid transporter-like MFS transporter